MEKTVLILLIYRDHGLKLLQTILTDNSHEEGYTPKMEGLLF